MKPNKLPDKGNRNKRNALGIVSIVIWALLLTVLFRGCWSSYENASTVIVPYTTFIQWVEEDKIDTVNIESSQYTFTLKEGVTVEIPEQERSTNATQELLNSLVPRPQEQTETKYVTIPLYGVRDDAIMDLFTAHGVTAYTEPVDSSAYFLNLFLVYILPILVMVLLFLFLFRGVGGKGGMGGLGGVGKAKD